MNNERLDWGCVPKEEKQKQKQKQKQTLTQLWSFSFHRLLQEKG